MAVTLVIGGARSGKSRHAEQLVAATPLVTYVATGQPGDGSDPEWSARVAQHRTRRPATWSSVETLDLVEVIEGIEGIEGSGVAIVVDCLGTWLTGLVDRAGAWDELDRAGAVVGEQTGALCRALHAAGADVVLVTNEVGMALVPQTPSGRFFQDQLGTLNACVAAVADHVHLVVAGRVLDLSNAPVVP